MVTSAMHDFEGLVTVVTGGASGIGAATAQMLSDRGASVFTINRQRHDDEPGIVALQADVSDDEAVESAIHEAVRRGGRGRLDVLVNNAGVSATGTVEDNPMDEWRHVIDVNLLGMVRASRAALPYLRQSSSAVVVNTCSVVADIGLPQRALYASSKGAILALTRAMAADHVHEGIRVCCVNPGTVATPWVDRLLGRTDDPASHLKLLEGRQPMGRLLTAEEVAHAIVSLASPLAGATTGVSLTVDGGLTTLRLPPRAEDH